jgi:lipopolysaccharide/colanic/teichoic acid biosynthesis glycosyltransferase
MWYFIVKRTLDITLSSVGVVLTAPLFLITVVTIKFDSPGPVFADTPHRVGKEGKVFKMYKFRSMIKDAHVKLRKDPKFKNFYEKYKKNNFKIRTDDDPRITRVGKIIRKTSVDELPQLVNILKGEMSLVGPRAFHVDEMNEQHKKYPYSKKHTKKALRVRPGLTGPWQVSGRSSVDFPERIKLDATYAENNSVLYDLKIIIKTIPAVFKGEGN